MGNLRALRRMPRMNLTKQIGHFRSFLNKPFKTSLSSNISYTVKVDSYNQTLVQEGLYHDVSIEFNMSDCNKTISLDFSISNDEEMENSIHKLDVIIQACQLMKRDLKTANREITKGRKRLDQISSQDNSQ